MTLLGLSYIVAVLHLRGSYKRSLEVIGGVDWGPRSMHFFLERAWMRCNTNSFLSQDPEQVRCSVLCVSSGIVGIILNIVVPVPSSNGGLLSSWCSAGSRMVEW